MLRVVTKYTDITSLYDLVGHNFITSPRALRFIVWAEENEIDDAVLGWVEDCYGSTIFSESSYNDDGCNVECLAENFSWEFQSILNDLGCDEALIHDCKDYVNNKSVHKY